MMIALLEQLQSLGMMSRRITGLAHGEMRLTAATTVSRARAVLHIVGNREWALDCRVTFIEKLARRTLPDDGTQPQRQREPYQSPWEKVLAEALRQAGIAVVPQYPIAGRFLDLAILSPRKIDVEVDGESVHRYRRRGPQGRRLLARSTTSESRLAGLPPLGL